MAHDPFLNENETLAEHRGLTDDYPHDMVERQAHREKPLNETLRNFVHFLKAPS